jgi:hypothetical protein
MSVGTRKFPAGAGNCAELNFAGVDTTPLFAELTTRYTPAQALDPSDA